MKVKYSIPLLLFTGSLLFSCGKSSDSDDSSFITIKTEKPKKKKASKFRAEYIYVDPNVKLHVTDLGNGKPVVLIHGYPLSDAMWEYQYHDLIKAGYRVIGITLRGFGQSDKPFGPYNYDQFASDIKAVLDTLKIENATLGGHSMGGAIALHYTAKYNAAHINKLALFAASAPCHTKKPDYPYPLFTKEEITQWVNLNNTNRPAFFNAVGEKFVLSPTSVPEGMGAWLGTIEWQASPYAMEQALIALRDEDIRADLPKIKIPTLIFNAKEDNIVSFALAEQMHQAIPNSKLVAFEKSGHALFLEETGKFNSEFLAFLKE